MGSLLMAQLAEDNDFVARYRLGDATLAEDDEWICRIVGRLSLPHGKLGCNRVVVDVPAGDYLADLRCYLPCATARFALEWVVKPAVGDARALVRYWQRTRPRQPKPAWLIQAQMYVVDNEDEARELEEEIGDRLDKPHVEFVIRLAPLPARLPPPKLARDSFFAEARPKGYPKPGPDAPYCCVWECHKPASCPQGISPGKIWNPGI